MLELYARLATWARSEEGQTLAEYALILVFIAIVAIMALTFLGQNISGILSDIGSALAGAPS